MAERHPGDTGSYLQAVPATFGGLLLGVLLSASVMLVLSARRTVLLGSVLQALAVAAGSVLARQLAGRNVAGLLAVLTGAVAVMAAGCPLIVALIPWEHAPTLALALVPPCT